MMGRYKVIFWDLDQTLLNFDRSMDYALRAVFNQYHLSINDDIVARYDAINGELLESSGTWWDYEGRVKSGAVSYIV